jgi:hypothetical protein
LAVKPPSRSHEETTTPDRRSIWDNAAPKRLAASWRKWQDRHHHHPPDHGDWTTMGMIGWKDMLNSNAIQPVQQFAYTKGKNSTDSALIIDAMDILHGELVDAFCIVSSDSDYTRLATRLRESGIFVMGVGEKAPHAFVQVRRSSTWRTWMCRRQDQAQDQCTGRKGAASAPHPRRRPGPSAIAERRPDAQAAQGLQHRKGEGRSPHR